MNINSKGAFFLEPISDVIPAIVEAFKYSPYIQKIFGDGTYKGTNVYGYNRNDNAIATLPSISVYHNTLSSPDDFYGYFGNVIVDVYNEVAQIREDKTNTIDARIGILVNTIQNPNFAFAVRAFLLNYNVNKNLVDFIKATNNYEIIDRLGYNLGVKFNYGTIESHDKMAWKSTITFDYQLSKEAYRLILQELGVEIYYDPDKIIYPLWETIELELKEVKLDNN